MDQSTTSIRPQALLSLSLSLFQVLLPMKSFCPEFDSNLLQTCSRYELLQSISRRLHAVESTGSNPNPRIEAQKDLDTICAPATIA